MERLPRITLDRIIGFYEGGRSLNYICKELGLAKSTIYYHTRKKFGRKYVRAVFDYTPTANLGEFLGLFATDGNFYTDKKRYHYTLTISLSRNQLEYAYKMQDIIQSICGKRPRIDVKARIVKIVIRSKAMLAFLKHFLEWKGRKSHSIHLKDSALLLGRDFLKGVIRGLVTGDGGVYPPKHRIAFGVVSSKLARQFCALLLKFEIPSHLYSVPYKGKKTLFHVHVTGRINLQKFKLRVGLTDPLKDNQLTFALRR